LTFSPEEVQEKLLDFPKGFGVQSEGGMAMDTLKIDSARQEIKGSASQVGFSSNNNLDESESSDLSSESSS
jgi:hypothetical protein